MGRSRSVRRRAALALAVMVLAACADTRINAARYAQSALIGMPEQTLLSCAGAPDKRASVDNYDYYTYRSRRTDVYPSMNMGLGYGFYHGGMGYWGAPPWPDDSVDVRTAACEATFTLKNGTVRQLTYGGPNGDVPGRLSQCYYIVQNCLALIPQQTGQ